MPNTQEPKHGRSPSNHSTSPNSDDLAYRLRNATLTDSPRTRMSSSKSRGPFRSASAGQPDFKNRHTSTNLNATKSRSPFRSASAGQPAFRNRHSHTNLNATKSRSPFRPASASKPAFRNRYTNSNSNLNLGGNRNLNVTGTNTSAHLKGTSTSNLNLNRSRNLNVAGTNTSTDLKSQSSSSSRELGRSAYSRGTKAKRKSVSVGADKQ
jgi:hypothetical protein